MFDDCEFLFIASLTLVDNCVQMSNMLGRLVRSCQRPPTYPSSITKDLNRLRTISLMTGWMLTSF